MSAIARTGEGAWMTRKAASFCMLDKVGAKDGLALVGEVVCDREEEGGGVQDGHDDPTPDKVELALKVPRTSSCRRARPRLARKMLRIPTSTYHPGGTGRVLQRPESVASERGSGTLLCVYPHADARALCISSHLEDLKGGPKLLELDHLF